MKTTSYEISKQLAEAGFKGKSIFGWHVDGKECAPAYPLSPTATGFFWSYDLETILEALPKFIEYNNRKYCLTFWVAGEEIYYEIIGENDLLENYFYIFATEKKENKSLADTAAKLWLKLKKEGLV